MLNKLQSDFLSLATVPQQEVYTNGRMKINPMNGEVLEYVVSNRPLFRALEVETRDKVSSRDPGLESQGDSDAKKRSAQRARKRLFDLAACNRFTLFFTLTIAPDKLDRYDYKTVMKKLNKWLSNRVERYGFAYIAVPERHKDGALHFHGLSNENGVKMAPSGHRDKSGRGIYNIVNWPYGFTTAVKLDGEYENVCKYITKYISKGAEAGTIGGRYFFHGGSLTEPKYIYFNADFGQTEGNIVEIEGAGGLRLCYVNQEAKSCHS